MTQEIGLLVHADLASIKTDAQDLIGAAMTPAQLDGGEATSAESGAGAGFAQSMRAAIHGVDAQDRVATDKMADVDSGRSDDLVGAMLSSQQASLSFSMLMQVRNKVMGAVDELSKLSL
jgi:flagellar hook-basal body complex protein FliE